ncbi:RNA polymerase sigma factor, partial [Vibrio parahaemolyticus]
AFDQLSLRYRGRLIAFCGRFLASPEAEDATQDTLLLAWRSLAQLNSTGSFATWLYRIARNHCLNLLRRRGAHLSLDDEQSHLFERIAHMEAPP